MGLKAYNRYKTQVKFMWICNYCRLPEEMPTNDSFDYKQCKPDDLPESWKSLKNHIKKDEEIFLHFNARSLINKGDEILEICQELNPALILFTETWFDESCPKGTCVPKGYKVLRKDRSEVFKHIYGKRNGGGVAIFMREDINIRTHITLNSDKNEILWCTLSLKGKQHLIGLIYRANYTSLLEKDEKGDSEMETLLQATADYSNMIIMGDTNCDTRSPNPSKETNIMLKITDEYGLKQLIDKPTRFNKTSATTIDHIYTRNDETVVKSGTCHGISDHSGIYCVVKADKNPNIETKRCRSFQNFNEEEFQNDLTTAIQNSNFNLHMDNEDLNSAFNTWLHAIKYTSDIHAPWKEFKRTQKTNHIPWYSKELDELKDQKNRSLRLYRLYRNPDDLAVYKRTKNIQTHLKRSLKREYYKNKIDSFDGNPRKIWQVLKDVTDRNYKEDVLPDNPNKTTANKFNSFFAKVGKTVQEKLKIDIKLPDINKEGTFKFKDITENDITSLIKRIRPDVATGSDEISARLLKSAAPAIRTHLRDMVNLSYKSSTFPEALKKAHVKTLHKEGDHNDPAQYRPISILSVISKIFERSAIDQLIEFFIKNNKLNTKQHAYKKQFSTVTCLFGLIESIRKQIDKKNLVAIASLDLSKAFDSLSHELILEKLIEKDVDSSGIKWIQSYLKNRKQCVKFGKVISDEEYVESGVPQGSILGPLLFITCTDDLPFVLNDYETFSYADDTQIMVITGKSIMEIQKKLIEALKKANKYYNNNSLLNNISKTKIILFGSQKDSRVEITPKDFPQLEKPIYNQDYLKILGLYVDKELNWNKHISQIKKNATNSIRNLHRANKLLPMKQKRILYNSLVAPIFSYADIIWNNCSKENSKRLQLSQNFAAKSMLGLGKRSSSTEALKKLELLPLEEKRNIHSAVLVKKALDGTIPKELSCSFKNQTRPEGLRPGNLQLPKHSSHQYQKGPFYTSIKIWNSVPNDLKNLKEQNFKTSYQKHKLKNFIES